MPRPSQRLPRIPGWLVSLVITGLFVIGPAVVSAQPLNNASLVPPYLPASDVTLEGGTPDWAKSLIIAEFRIETATAEGTFDAAVDVLDHYAEMGVSGIWINPIYERGSRGNGYLSFGPHTIEPLLTGQSDPETSWATVRRFVDEAHRRNIRVFWDIIVWGTASHAPLVGQHPEFYRRRDGDWVRVWGGYAFDWQNDDLRQWFHDAAVELIERTGADGFRVDLAPDTSGYFFQSVRQTLYQRGHKVLIISEMNGERRGTFDFEQVGVNGWTEEPDYFTPGVLADQKSRFGKHHDYLLHHDIVNVVQTGRGLGKATLQQAGLGGTERFYTSNLLHHDDRQPFVGGSRLKIGYTALFAPFIPMWWIGEEWNNPRNPLPDSDGVMFFNRIDWQAKQRPENAAFFESVKRMIQIRRQHADIFEHFPDNHRHSNIASVRATVAGTDTALPLAAYARWSAGKAILIVPNPHDTPQHAAISLDFAAWNLYPAGRYQATELISGQRLAEAAEDQSELVVKIAADDLAVILFEAN